MITQDEYRVLATFKEFNEWYVKFSKDNGFQNIKIAEQDWEYFQEKHEKIRSLMGGIAYDMELEFINESKGVGEEILDEIVKETLKLFPDMDKDAAQYLNVTSTKEAFREPLASQRGSNHNFLKIGTFITQAISNRWYGRAGKEEKIKQGSLIAQKLADYWQKYNTKEGTLRAVLSTNFEDIIKIGHYKNIDTYSCFRGGGRSKFRLAFIPDSYVVHFYDKNRHCGRMWGMYKDDNMNFSNLYAKGAHEGNIRAACRMIYANIMGVDEERVNEHLNKLTTNPEGALYLNGYDRITLSTSNNINYQQIDISTAIDYCRKRFNI